MIKKLALVCAMALSFVVMTGCAMDESSRGHNMKKEWYGK